MSKYTTEVRFICESKAGLDASAGYNSIDEIVTTAAPLIFNFSFPIYDETYRLPLEKRILKHFYTREICEETVGLWQLRLEDKLNLIMPYYNDLYKSALIEFNPMYDVDLSTDRSGNKNDSITANDNRETSRQNSGNEFENANENNNRKENNTKTGNSISEKSQTGNNVLRDNINESENVNKNGNTSNDGSEQNIGNDTKTIGQNNNSWDLFSDTPQSGIDGIAASGSTLADNGYLTNARNQFGDQNTTENDKTNSNKTTHDSGNKDETENRIKTGINSKEENKNENYNETGTTNEVGNANSEDNKTMNRDSAFNNNGFEKTHGDEVRNVTSLEKYAEHVIGKRGYASYSKLLQEFRDTFIKIEEMLFNDMNDLFFGLW